MPPDGAVEPVELGVHAVEDAIHEYQDQTQRMLGGQPLFQGLVAKQFVLLEVRAAHRGLVRGVGVAEWYRDGFFNSLLTLLSELA